MKRSVVVVILVALALSLIGLRAALAQSRDRSSRSERNSDRSSRDSSSSSRSQRSSNSSRSDRSDRSDRSSSSRTERSSDPAPSPAPPPSTQPSATGVATVLVSPPLPSHPEVAPSADFSARYAIVTDKNIFVRNRPPTRTAGGSRDSSRSSSPRRPEEAFVLRGVALQEGRNVAFIENTSAQSTQRLVAGDSVAGGKIVAMHYDSLEFETSVGRRETIQIGRNLLGDVYSGGGGGGGAFASSSSTTMPTTGPSANTSSSSSSAAAADKGPTPPPLPNAENLSLEERMKLRAQQLRK